jgi:hypothetical protein
VLGAMRGERGRPGRERALAFTWEAAARGTLEAYERALHARRRRCRSV